MKKLRTLLVWVLFLCVSFYAKAEGTKEVSPSESNLTALASLPSTGGGSYLNCPEDNRIYFRIKDFTTENFYYGLRPHLYAGFGTHPSYDRPADSMFIRIYNPSGAVVFQKKLDTTAGAAGFINTYNQAIAGPNIGGLVPSGYNPLIFTPTQNGDYWIEIYYSLDNGASMLPNALVSETGAWTKMCYFDFTVATTTNTRYPGRVHCDKWNMVAITNAAGFAGTYSTGSFFIANGNASSESVFFAYTTDSVVMKIDFEPGFRPIAYNVAVNNYGVANTGNWLVDRRSINSSTAPTLANGYKIFLNDPDITLYPSGIVPGSASFPEPTMKGCPPSGPYKLRYKIPAAADVVILLDINGIAGYQPSTTDRVIEQPSRSAGLNTYTWDGKDGLGNQLASGTTITFSVSTYFQKGKASVPLYDAEINKAGFKMAGIRPVATPALRMFWDDSQLTNVGACGGTAATTSSANNVTGVGINNSLFGTPAPSHAWNGNGNLSNVVPAPNAVYCSSPLVNDSIAPTQYQWDDFGNVRIINTWSYGIENYISKSIKLLCVKVSGTVFNDVDGSAAGTFNGIQTGSESGSNGGTLYAALVDPETNEVIGYGIVAANGTYTINGVPVNATGLKLIITTTLPVVDSPAPTASIPSGYGNTSPTTNTINTLEVDVNNLNFGINQLPESAVNLQSSLLNPGGTVNYNVPSNAFNTSNVGSNPNTQDYGGGTVTSIRITSFPANATSITINGIQYGACGGCTAWPVGGVTTPYTSGSGPTSPISIDPVDGFVDVVINFAAIDNAGNVDNTPGSVTLSFNSILEVKYVNFTAYLENEKAILKFNIANPVIGSTFFIERSINGNSFSSVGTINSTNDLFYSFVDPTPIKGTKNYYRIKEMEQNGNISFSEIRFVNLSSNGRLDIYPLPASNYFNIGFNASYLNRKVIINIFDMQGKLLFNKIINKVKSTETINVEALKNGAYLLNIINENNVTEVRKINILK